MLLNSYSTMISMKMKKINNYKHVYMERIGSECAAEDIPFFLEIVTYDAENDDAKK